MLGRVSGQHEDQQAVHLPLHKPSDSGHAVAHEVACRFLAEASRVQSHISAYVGSVCTKFHGGSSLPALVTIRNNKSMIR
jgi:hypothetical protein